jgi:Protein of unknown function (DUF2877)
MRLTARSASRTAMAIVRHSQFSARVLAAFALSCDLVTPNGEVIALVTPLIGNGPLSIVLDAESPKLAATSPGTQAWLAGDTLHVGNLEVDLKEASLWEPCPDWSALRARLETVVARLSELQATALRLAPASSLLRADSAASYAIVSEAKNLELAWEGDTTQLRETAVRLAGLGIGLTPAGDDFLAGLMLWAWLAHPAPGPFCQAVAEGAAPRTTTLSAAFLRAAARGECDAAWHRLFAALSVDGAAQLAPPISQVVAHGATSGADMLAGFLRLAVR